MADPSSVDAAIVAKLVGDSTLMNILTDGVWIDVAKNGAQRFAIVSLVAHEDGYSFNNSAFEKSIYLVKAVILNASGADVKTAAARIHTLLQDVALTITGYAHSLTRRAERIRYTEVDDINPEIRWQHRGGRYEIFVSPTA